VVGLNYEIGGKKRRIHGMKKVITPLIILLLSGSCIDNKELSESDYIEFGKQLCNELNHEVSPSKLKKYIDILPTFKLFQKVINDNKLSNYIDQSGYEFDAVGLENIFVSNLVKLSNTKGKYTFRKLFYDDTRPNILLQLDNQESKTFFELELVTKNGKVFVSDIYSYLTGISIQDSFIFYELDKINPKHITGYHYDVYASLESCVEYMKQGRYKRAWDKFEGIPDEYKYRSNFQTFKMALALKMSDSLYVMSLSEWIEHMNDEGLKYYQSYQLHNFNGDFSKASLFLDSLEVVFSKY